MKTNREHPDVTQFIRAVLWSINERAAGRPGIDLPPPTLDWLDDCAEFYDWEQKDLERQAREK